MTQDQRNQIEGYAKSLKWGPKNFYWEHTTQVRDFALMIQRKVGGDKDVVEAAALLHDIGKAKLLAPEHEEISANLAETVLKKVEFSKDKIDKVVECIKYENFEPIEAQILRSADSMSLIMDESGGKEWYFKTILKNDKKNILHEIEKSYSEIEFDFAQKFVEETYNRLLERYK
jgi:putative nucleotidyltransferase with HDIG domain